MTFDGGDWQGGRFDLRATTSGGIAQEFFVTDDGLTGKDVSAGTWAAAYADSWEATPVAATIEDSAAADGVITVVVDQAALEAWVGDLAERTGVWHLVWDDGAAEPREWVFGDFEIRHGLVV